MRHLFPVLLLAACGPELVCDEGFESNASDGLCYEQIDEVDPVQAFLDDLPTCEPGAAGPTDAVAGCLRGQCVGTATWAEVSTALDLTIADCDEYSTLAFCTGADFTADFYDEDATDTLTDADTLDSFSTAAPGDRDADGIGIGSSLACYLERDGDPDQLSLDETGITRTSYGGLELRLTDGLVTGLSFRL